MADIAISIQNVNKRFGDTHAVRELNLDAVSYTHLTLPTSDLV